MSNTSRRIACFGGVYSNYLALEAALADARAHQVDAIFCLGDFGAFGPYPDRTIELLREHEVTCIQGNYDQSIASDRDDCQCGYTDPRDNHFARLSYQYTRDHTSAAHRRWMATLPATLRWRLGPLEVLMCHGSPRRTNEFLWESTTSTHFLEKLLADCQADLVLATHTGLHWERRLSAGRRFVNVGVLGRPENNGRTEVGYTLLALAESADPNDRLGVEFIPIEYDHGRLAREMRHEGLPEEFAETILTGWWTSCLEVLPSKERRAGRF